MPIDMYGQDVDANYMVFGDLSFERRLKAFDPRLKLLFDRTKKRWVVAEWAYDNSGWNIILVAEHSDGRTKPLGEWVFNQLWVKRQRYDHKRSKGVEDWFSELVYQSESQKEKIDKNESDNHQAMLRDDVTQWRKASKENQNLPVSDAMAGYRKVSL